MTGPVVLIEIVREGTAAFLRDQYRRCSAVESQAGREAAALAYPNAGERQVEAVRRTGEAQELWHQALRREAAR